MGKTVLEVSHPSSHALVLWVQRQKGSAVPQIECSAAIGNVRIDTDDVFVTRCLLLQRNVREYVNGRREPPTALSVINGMKCELNQRTKPPDITVFLKFLDIRGLSSSGDSKRRRQVQVTGSFRRLQSWMPHLFAVPQGVFVEDQELRIPSVYLQSVLGDSGSVKNRLKGSVLPHLKRQWTNESAARKLEVYASNFETILDEATGGTGVSAVLAQKRSELGFREVEFADNTAIIKTHIRELRVARSQVDFDRSLWHLLFDWDFNHTGLDPMRRRIVGVAVLNRSSRTVMIRDIRLAEGDKAYRSNVKMPPLSSVWHPSHTSVVVATGNSPFGARLGLASGEVTVHIETTALRIEASHTGVRLTPLCPDVAHNVVGVHIHQWWSLTTVLLSDKAVSLASRETRVEVCFREPGPLGLVTEEDAQTGGVTITKIDLARQSGSARHVRPGSRLAAIGERDCARLPYAECIELIRQHPQRPLVLAFCSQRSHAGRNLEPAPEPQPEPAPELQPQPDPESEPQERQAALTVDT